MEGAHLTEPESVLFGIVLGYVLLGYRRRSTYSSSRRSSLSNDVLLRSGWAMVHGVSGDSSSAPGSAIVHTTSRRASELYMRYLVDLLRNEKKLTTESHRDSLCWRWAYP